MNGFLMLPSYYDALRPLPDDQRLALYDAILDYAFARKEPEGLPPILKGYFSLLRPNIDSSIKRYTASVENGKKGGRPKDPSGNLKKTKQQPSENQEKEKDREKESETEYVERASLAPTPSPDKKSRPRFIPPTLEEVADYVRERGSAVDPQGFIDFYAAKGWMVGKSPMKDWKAACRNAEHWERWQERSATHGSVSSTEAHPGTATKPKRWNLPTTEL